MDTSFVNSDFANTVFNMSKTDLDDITAFFQHETPSAPEKHDEANEILFGDCPVDSSSLSSEDRTVFEHVQGVTGVQVVQPVLQQDESSRFVDAVLSFDDFPVDAPSAQFQTYDSFNGQLDSTPFSASETNVHSPLDASDYFLNMPSSSQDSLFVDHTTLVTEAPPPMSMPDFTHLDVVATGVVQPVHQQEPYRSGPVVISQETYQRLVGDNTGQQHAHLQDLCGEQVISVSEVDQSDSDVAVPALGVPSPSSADDSESEYEEAENSDDNDETPSNDHGNIQMRRPAGVTFGKRPSRDYAEFPDEAGRLWNRRWQCCGNYNGRHMRPCILFNSVKHHTAGSWVPDDQKILARECDFCKCMVCVSCHYQRKDLEFEYGCPEFPSFPTGIRNRRFACNWCHSEKGGNKDGMPILAGEVYKKSPYGAMNVGMRAQMKKKGLVPKCDRPKSKKRAAPDTPTPAAQSPKRRTKKRRSIAI